MACTGFHTPDELALTVLLENQQHAHQLRHNLLQHVSMHVRKTSVNAVVPHREPSVVDP